MFYSLRDSFQDEKKRQILNPQHCWIFHRLKLFLLYLNIYQIMILLENHRYLTYLELPTKNLNRWKNILQI
jgi:hypothetical protein